MKRVLIFLYIFVAKIFKFYLYSKCQVLYERNARTNIERAMPDIEDGLVVLIVLIVKAKQD